MDCFREFQESSDQSRLRFEPKLIEGRPGARVSNISVEMRPNFENSAGMLIEGPYLLVRALLPSDESEGLGVAKCKAICAVERDLRQWVVRHGGVA